MRSMRSAKAASGAAIAGTTTALSQDKRPKEPGMALSRQSLAVGTIGPVKPEPKKQQAPQGAGRTRALAGELRQPPGPSITSGIASSNWAVRSE